VYASLLAVPGSGQGSGRGNQVGAAARAPRARGRAAQPAVSYSKNSASKAPCSISPSRRTPPPPVALRRRFCSAGGQAKGQAETPGIARQSDKGNPVIWSLAVLQYRDSIGDQGARPTGSSATRTPTTSTQLASSIPRRGGRQGVGSHDRPAQKRVPRTPSSASTPAGCWPATHRSPRRRRRSRS
jgi:hypothetical protein